MLAKINHHFPLFAEVFCFLQVIGCTQSCCVGLKFSSFIQLLHNFLNLKVTWLTWWFFRNTIIPQCTFFLTIWLRVLVFYVQTHPFFNKQTKSYYGCWTVQTKTLLTFNCWLEVFTPFSIQSPYCLWSTTMPVSQFSLLWFLLICWLVSDWQQEVQGWLADRVVVQGKGLDSAGTSASC